MILSLQFSGFKTTIRNWMKINVIYLLENTNMKVFGQKLGMDIDRTLSFNKYVSNLCKKAGTKLSVLAKLSSCMTLTQRGLLMKSYIESQFGYCLLVWMFHDRLWNRSINHLLQIVYSDSISSFHELLQKNHFPLFTTETFKVWLTSYIK